MIMFAVVRLCEPFRPGIVAEVLIPGCVDWPAPMADGFC